MILTILDKKAIDEEFRYKDIYNVDYFILNDELIEIHYINGARESRSVDEIEILNIEIESKGMEKKNFWNYYKGNLCPVCKKPLMFNNDYSKVACQNYWCTFNIGKSYFEFLRFDPNKYKN